MDRQEITYKIMEIARQVSDRSDCTSPYWYAGQLEYLFVQLDALQNQEVKR